jgi:hypothetical protein
MNDVVYQTAKAMTSAQRVSNGAVNCKKQSRKVARAENTPEMEKYTLGQRA